MVTAAGRSVDGADRAEREVRTGREVRAVRAHAPVRVCDVGGWTDTWFGSPGQVCSIAVSPGVQVLAELVHQRGPAGDGAGPVHLVAPDLGEDYRFGPATPSVDLAPTPSADADPLPYLMRAIEKDPENALFRDTLGWYHFKKGMFAEATIEIGKAFLYDPKNLEVRVHFATVLEWIGKEQEALEQWTKVLELADDERVKRVAHEHYWDLKGRGVTASAN